MRDSRKDLTQVQKAKSGFKKATLVGVLALFFTFSFSSRALAQDYDSSPAASTFINTLKGTEVSTDVTTTDRSTDDESKIFFLYNEESGKFLNVGGYWGTHVVVSDVPRPFWLEDAGNGTYYITSKVVASDQTSVAKENNIGNGNYVGWATNNKTTDKDPLLSSYGVFASLPLSSGDKRQFAWHFEKVTGSTDKYHIYLNLSNVNVPTVTKDAIKGDPFASTTATITWGEPVTGAFYLEAATSENVYGDYNQETKKYPTDPNYYYEFKDENEQSHVYCIYPGAEAVKDESPSKTSEWKLISLKEYKTLFDKSYKELTGENTGEDFPSGVFDPTQDMDFSSAKINVSYLLQDPDFQINNPELNQWKYRNAEGANADIKDYISVGFDGYLKKATGDGFDDTYTNEYTDINGNSEILTDYQISNRARRMGLQVKENNGTNQFGQVKGEIYQTIQITKPGLYTLSGNYDYDMNTTQKPSLFVRYNNYEKAVGNIGGNTNATYNKFYYLNEKGYSIDWPNSYGFPMYNALAGHHNGYLNFFISPKLLAKHGGSITVEFGMIIDHTNRGVTSKPYISTFANENSDDTSNSDDINYSWSVIDNFQLSFRGQPKPDLILDEDEENLDYIEKASDSYNNLRLHRTFSTDKWNSIILPMGLTKEQYTSAFGDAPLAELKNLTQSEIQFETVTDKNVNDNNEYWLKPMTPYIIKANKANGSETEKYEGYYNYWDEYITNAKDSVFSKTINGEEKPYFLISNVKMANGIIPTTAHTGTDYEYQNKIAPMWNFKGLTANTYTMDKEGAVNKADCPYVVTTNNVTSNKGYIAAFGTLARNYTYAENSDGTTSTTKSLIAGRPSLKDSYAMSGNKLTYYSAGTAMKGFRCWFEYTADKTTGGTSSAKPMPTLLLDGVNMTTGIDEIMANDEGISMISQYQKGIFSLGGQRISQDASSFDALPKGIYIVNGKKVIKD